MNYIKIDEKFATSTFKASYTASNGKNVLVCGPLVDGKINGLGFAKWDKIVKLGIVQGDYITSGNQVVFTNNEYEKSVFAGKNKKGFQVAYNETMGERDWIDYRKDENITYEIWWEKDGSLIIIDTYDEDGNILDSLYLKLSGIDVFQLNHDGIVSLTDYFPQGVSLYEPSGIMPTLTFTDFTEHEPSSFVQLNCPVTEYKKANSVEIPLLIENGRNNTGIIGYGYKHELLSEKDIYRWMNDRFEIKASSRLLIEEGANPHLAFNTRNNGGISFDASAKEVNIISKDSFGARLNGAVKVTFNTEGGYHLDKVIFYDFTMTPKATLDCTTSRIFKI